MPARPALRSDTLFAVLVAIGLGSSVGFAQTAPVDAPPFTKVGGGPVTLSGPAATEPAAPSLPSWAVATAPAEPAAITQPFVGVVSADKVYVRSGPGTIYYELGHVTKGDTVQVVGSKNGWYEIFPPNGTFCLIAKDLVDADAGGKWGTVKGDYVNLRAGTSLGKQDVTVRDGVVLCVVRKGQKLTILGIADKYYEVAPTERAFVYINPQFVKAAPVGTEYKIPELKPGGGVTGAIGNTVTEVGTIPPAVEPTRVTPPVVATTLPGGEVVTTGPALPPVQPSVTFSKDAYSRFNELDKRYQAELLKPVGTRELDGLVKDYKELSEQKDAAPSVKQGSESRIAAIQKLMTIQRLQKENAASADALAEQRKALQEQYATAQRAIEAYENTGPYLAEGTLQTSTAVSGKYALVNPATGRTVAYVDPASQIDIGSLLGKYIGVRGNSVTAEGTQVTVIKVKNATLLPSPK